MSGKLTNEWHRLTQMGDWNGTQWNDPPLSQWGQMADDWVADSVDDVEHVDGHEHLSVHAIINFLKLV